MKKLLFTLTALFCLTGLLFFVGCSDDDDGSTNPRVKETGDTTDPVFETAGLAFEASDEMSGLMFQIMFNTLDTIQAEFPQASSWKAPGTAVPTSPESDSVYLTYHGDSQYWYLFFQMIDTVYNDTGQEIYTIVFEDSLQFKHGTEIVQYPDSALLTGLNRGITLVWSFGDLLVECNQQFSLVGDLPGYGDIVINGNSSFNGSFSFVMDSSGAQHCDFNMDLTGVYSDLAMNLAAMDTGACPTSGTASYGGNIAANCEGDTAVSFNEQWSVVQTFDNGVIHYVVENSTTRWEFDETCGGGGVTVSRNRLSPFLNQMQ